MGATPAKMFAQPGSYAMDNENVVAPQDPVPQAPQQQFVSQDSYSNSSPSSVSPTSSIKLPGNLRKFFGDMELDGTSAGPRRLPAPGTGPKFPNPPPRPPIKVPGY